MRDPLVLRYPASAGPARLERQLRVLLMAGWQPVRFSDAVLRPVHNRALVVSFDGALATGITAALGKLRVPGTLFTRPGEDVDALVAAGWEIGALVDPPVAGKGVPDTLSCEATLAELRAAVAAGSGRPCESFAVADGAVSVALAQAARDAGFRCGAGVQPLRDLERRPSTRLRWGRLSVAQGDGLVRFGARVARAVDEAGGQAAARPDEELPPPPATDGAPRVAVVIPCFEDGEFAREAAASIAEREPVEIVVVDDASEDPETAAALAALAGEGIRVVRHDANAGPSAARRTGLASTAAPYVYTLDADDKLVPGALALLADRLDADPEAAASWGDILVFGASESRGSTPVWLDPFRVALRNEFPVSALFRREALVEAGAWRDVGGAVSYEDWTLWMTLAEAGARGVHAGPGVFGGQYRLHGPRRLADAAGHHRQLYGAMRDAHPRLFAGKRANRRQSDLPWASRLLWPVIYGGRPPLGLRRRLTWLLGPTK